MPTKVFWLERTDRVKVWLRRYRSDCPKGKKTATWTETCEAQLLLHANAPAREWGRWQWRKWGKTRRRYWHQFNSKIKKSDHRWARMRCERCGGKFDRGDPKQLWADHLFRGAPDKKLYTLRDAPIGAMWDAEWLHDAGGAWTGPDGLSLHVRTPGGDWCVDSQASNCTQTQDVDVPGKPGWKRFTRTHYCWIRHGDPRTGNVHVDKNGNTCSAGGGSIAIGKYHGFLNQGYLTDG